MTFLSSANSRTMRQCDGSRHATNGDSANQPVSQMWWTGRCLIHGMLCCLPNTAKPMCVNMQLFCPSLMLYGWQIAFSLMDDRKHQHLNHSYLYTETQGLILWSLIALVYPVQVPPNWNHEQNGTKSSSSLAWRLHPELFSHLDARVSRESKMKSIPVCY